MSYAKIKGPLKTRIGREVIFGRPKDVRRRIGEGCKTGQIVGEVWENRKINLAKPHRPRHYKNCWGDYSFCAQLIEWCDKDSPPKYQVRLGYYRRRCGENSWELAGQTTVTSEWRRIKRLCEKILDPAKWKGQSPQSVRRTSGKKSS